jgi:hypothetical protein
MRAASCPAGQIQCTVGNCHCCSERAFVLQEILRLRCAALRMTKSLLQQAQDDFGCRVVPPRNDLHQSLLRLPIAIGTR